MIMHSIHAPWRIPAVLSNPLTALGVASSWLTGFDWGKKISFYHYSHRDPAALKCYLAGSPERAWLDFLSAQCSAPENRFPNAFGSEEVGRAELSPGAVYVPRSVGQIFAYGEESGRVVQESRPLVRVPECLLKAEKNITNFVKYVSQLLTSDFGCCGTHIMIGH
ncbi:hypothetical protein E4U53_006245 [Claviceps sorghi]|nr:hypothetical protein E4U53_006245 [Claviceps sorghi]